MLAHRRQGQKDCHSFGGQSVPHRDLHDILPQRKVKAEHVAHTLRRSRQEALYAFEANLIYTVSLSTQ